MNSQKITPKKTGIAPPRAYRFPRLALAPMAGITDLPWRRICAGFGADWLVGEMISGAPSLKNTAKTRRRLTYTDKTTPRVVQIVGNEPEAMAAAAMYYQEQGADVIDINMGCPAKKVCERAAGSALLKDEKLVAAILEAVVTAVTIPVTLKTRLGWDDEHLNVKTIAKIAEASGIAALAIHGRSRTQMFRGEADYRLIKEVKEETGLPLWVNGDIDSGKKAKEVLAYTGADGVMVGRAARGRPWLFHEIKEYLREGRYSVLPFDLIIKTIKQHLQEIYAFYGADAGTKIARKHIIWYLSALGYAKSRYQALLTETLAEVQLKMTLALIQNREMEERYYQQAVANGGVL